MNRPTPKPSQERTRHSSACGQTDGERNRLDCSRRRPADGPDALALPHQMANRMSARSVRRDAEQSDRDGRAPLSQRKCTGCVNAPLPAESHTEKRTHFFPVASNGIRKRREPNGGWSVAETIFRPTCCPSPQTASTKFSGKVHCTSATTSRLLPRPSTDQCGMSTSPVVTKNSPARRAQLTALQSSKPGTRSSFT